METDYKKIYEQAFEKIKDLYDNYDEISCLIDMKQEFEKAFPQLVESDDEKIRKAIISFVCEMKGDFDSFGGIKLDDMIAWLEKQGEKKQEPCKECDFPKLNCENFPCINKKAFEAMQWKDEQLIEQLTAFAVHLQKRGAFRDDLCMDFEHEAQSFIEMQKPTEL